MREKYDWETREDAETLKRYAELYSNPKRLQKAQQYIKSCITDYKKVLVKSKDNLPSRNNPATIMKLK